MKRLVVGLVSLALAVAGLVGVAAAAPANTLPTGVIYPVTSDLPGATTFSTPDNGYAGLTTWLAPGTFLIVNDSGANI